MSTLWIIFGVGGFLYFAFSVGFLTKYLEAVEQMWKYLRVKYERILRISVLIWTCWGELWGYDFQYELVNNILHRISKRCYFWEKVGRQTPTRFIVVVHDGTKYRQINMYSHAYVQHNITKTGLDCRVAWKGKQGFYASTY